MFSSPALSVDEILPLEILPMEAAYGRVICGLQTYQTFIISITVSWGMEIIDLN